MDVKMMQKKSPVHKKWNGGYHKKSPDDDLLSQTKSPLSWAQRRFTVLFGMGRGGTTLLRSSGIKVRVNAGLRFFFSRLAFTPIWFKHNKLKIGVG